jgi:hypothetical protein
MLVLLLICVGLFLFLLVAAVGMQWRRKRPAEPPASPAPAPPAPRQWERQPDEELDIAVLTFDGVVGAERAFARVRDDAGRATWLLDVAFVEHHHRDRIVVRGTFAGRYLDVEDIGGRLLDEIVADVPEGSSALLVFARPDEVETMVQAFAGSGASVAHHRVPAADAAAFEASVAQAPPVAPPPAVR